MHNPARLSAVSQMRLFFRSIDSRCCFGLLLLLATLLAGGCTAKAKLERHVKRGDAYFAKGEFESARIEYLNAFRLNQNDAYIAARLGETLLERGDILRGAQLLARARELQPTNTAVRVKLASLLMVGGNAKEARKEAEAILETSPLNPDGLVLLANSASTTNELAATRKRIEALAAANPQNSAIHLALGVLAQKGGDLAGAEKFYQQAVALEPKSSKNNFALANVCLAQNNTNKAETYYKAAIESAPLKSVERLGYAEFLMRTGRYAEAKALLEQTTTKAPEFVAGWNMLTQVAAAQNDPEKAAEYIKHALAQDPANRDALLNQARVTLSKRDYKSAMAELQKLTEEHPRDYQILYQLAVAQLGNDEPLKALATLDKALTLNPNYIEATLLRCQIQISRGDFSSATPELVRVTRQNPRVAQAHYLLAAAYVQRGAADDALAVYSNLTKIFPSDPQPYQMIGTLYRQQTNLVSARQAYEQALKLNPDYLAAIDDVIELDITSGKQEAALARIQGYIQKYPDKPMPRLLQAKVYFAQQKNAEAEAAVKKAIELDPEFYLAHRTLADFYVRTKQTDQAVTKLQAMVQKNPKDVGSLVQIGMLFESKNDYKRARDAYESVLKLSPNSIIALNNVAYILGERFGDVEAAVQYARKAHDTAPYDPFSADTYGWMLWKKGDFSLAAGPLQQAAQEFASRGKPQAEVLYHLGMAYYMTGATGPATTALESAVQSQEDFVGKDKARNALSILKVDPAKAAPETVAVLQKAIQENPGELLAYTRLAQVYEARSEWQKARENYEAALQKNPRSTLLLSKLARLYSGPLKNPERGLELARQAWSISQSPELAATLGPVGYTAGDYKWAYGLLLEAQRSAPDNAEVAYYSGLSAYALAKLPQANDSLTKAAQSGLLAAPLSSLAKSAASIAAFTSGGPQPDQAQAAVNAALALDSQFPPALLGSALLLEQKGDLNGARERYETILKAHPNFLLAQRNLAILLGEKLSDDAKAGQLATALRSEFQDDAQLSKVLGKVAYRRGDFVEAARYLRLASAKLGNDSDTIYHLGMAQYHLKDRSAKSTLTRAVTLEPNGKLTADAKKALAELK